MRALILLIATASLASAQTPVPGPTAPKAPGKGGGEFRVGGFMITADRSYEFRNAVTTGAGTIQGIDVLLRARGIGLQVKSLTGEFESQPHVTSADARVLLFPPVFSVMGGIGKRALWSDVNADRPNLFDIALAGVSSTVTIGGTGIRTNITAAMYVPMGESKDKIEKGLEGEASIIYRLPFVPLFVQAGYRTEVFTSKAGTSTLPEEVRGLKVGGGLQIGGR